MHHPPTTLLPPSYHPPGTRAASASSTRPPRAAGQTTPSPPRAPARSKPTSSGSRAVRRLRASSAASRGCANPNPNPNPTPNPNPNPNRVLSREPWVRQRAQTAHSPQASRHSPCGLHAASPPLRLTPYSSRTAYHGTSYYSLLAGARIRQLPQFRRGRRDRTRLEPQL